MNFETFINVLIRLDIMLNVNTARELWDSLGVKNTVADLENYRDLYTKTYEELFAVKEQLRELKANQANVNDEALAALRAKLMGDNAESEHEKLVLLALNSHNVIDFMGRGQKIQAIKELRFISNCGLKEAKDACDDPRVMAYFVRQEW